MMTQVCFVGDGALAGIGVEDGLGWPGRLARRLRRQGRAPSVYNLGVRYDTTAEIALRWERECAARLTDQGGVVFAFGLNDMATHDGDSIRVPLMDSLANAEAIVGRAAARWPVLWVGPPPVLPSNHLRHAVRPRGFVYSHSRLAGLNDAYQSLAAGLDVPYLDLAGALGDGPGWREALERGDGVHPDGHGYELLAAHVAAWDAWRDWFSRRGTGGGTVRPLNAMAAR